MKALFAPVIALLNRLGYPRKFAIMGALALVASSVLMFKLYDSLHELVENSEQELQGIEVIKPFARLVQHLQIHRGLSSGVLNGNEQMRTKREAKEKEVVQAFQSIETMLPPTLATNPAWTKAVEKWTGLQKEGMDLISRENFTTHTSLIDDLLSFQAVIADEFRLTNDPDIDSTYLIDTAIEKSPTAIERMGQLRALGTGMLAKKLPLHKSQEIEMTTILAQLNSAVSSLRGNMEKSARFNAELKTLFQSSIETTGKSTDKISTLINQDILSGTYATSPDDYFALVTASIDKSYQEMFENLFPTLQKLLQKRIDKANRDLVVNIAASAVILLLYAYVSIGLYHATIGGIGRLAEQARTIATGDLSVQVDLGTRDELKLVADSLNDMVREFRGLIQNVRGGATEVLDATKALAASAVKITSDSEEQRNSASKMAATIEEMTAGIDSLASNAQEANRLSSRAGELSADGNRVVGNVIHEIERIAEVVNKSAATIADLGTHSEEISVIVNVIKEIADQTNLLALNAAIEAARAGESGRGFAVVADEVRKLAERTTLSTQKISSMISTIQNGTREAVTSMELGVDCVAEGVALATKAGESINEIGDNARVVVEKVAGISMALREQSVASGEIARNVERVAAMAAENCTIVAGNAATAGQLEQLSEALEAGVNRFKLN
ncbi:MAG TPA: methyl-accepting chemotaxis protein [Accumulibacter sp.]|nr:methyl-accepting chemotaxis protein [Accumulibacter sp.]